MPPKIDEQPPRPVGSPDHELALKLVDEYRRLWMDQFKDAGVEPVKFTRISVLALTHVSAILAIDSGMSAEQFDSVCQTQFSQLREHAAKFAN